MDVSPRLSLQEFTSESGEATLYYQLLCLTGSVYVWVGTEQGSLGNLVAAFGSRMGQGASVETTILGPSGEGSQQVQQVARRLQGRTHKQVLLSVNLPSDHLLPHVEQRLLEELCIP